MSFETDMKDLEESGLFNRATALGKEADEELSKLEGKTAPKKHVKKVKRICLYCGEKSEEPDFGFVHACKKPMVVEEKEWPCPSRPMEIKFFEVKYHKKIYRFTNYHSAMRFRKLVWIDDIPLNKAIEDKYLRWY